MTLQNKLIICPHCLNKIFLLKRKNDPYLDFSLLSLEDLEKDLYPQVNEKGLKYLLENTDYPIKYISDVINYINRGINPSVNKDVETIYNLLDKAEETLLVTTGFLKQKFVNKEVIIVGYSKDNIELNSALKKYNAVNISYVHLDEFLEEKSNEPIIYKFKTMDEEVRYAFNKILANQNPDRTNCIICDPSYESILNAYAYKYDAKINFSNKETALHSLIGKKILNAVSEGKDILNYITSLKGSLDKNGIELLCTIEKVIKDNLINILNKNTYENVSYLLDKIKIPQIHYKNEIIVTSSLEFDPFKNYYLLGATDTFIPKIEKNNKIIDDSLLEINNINTSSIKNAENEYLSEIFIRRNFAKLITYPESKGKDSNYRNSFIDEEHEKTHEIINYDYSSSVAAAYFSRAKDIENKYGKKVSDLSYENVLKKKIDLETYDSSFNGIVQKDPNRVISFSYSSMTEYYSCPFKYYVEHILHLSDYESTFAGKLGIFIHKMFEYVDSKSFEEAYKEAQKEIGLADKFTKKEEMFIEADKELIKYAFENIKCKVFDVLKPEINKHEYKKSYKVDLSKNNLFINGSIDSFIIGKKDKTIIIFDFKSGGFSVGKKELYEAGLNLQLLIYSYMLSKDPDFSGYKIKGMYYVPVISKELNNQSKAFKDSFNYQGLTFIANTGFDEIIKSGGKVCETPLEDYLKIVKEKLIEADKSVRESKFSITPTKLLSESPCTYCNYSNICFKNKAKEYYKLGFIEKENTGEEDE